MIKFINLGAVIWDMDGVILDSEYAHFQAIRETFIKNNILINEEILGQSFGLTDRLVIEGMTGGKLTDSETERIRLEKDLLFLKLVSGQAEFLPGVQKWLSSFKQNGIVQALASSSAHASINQILGELNALQYFDAVVSGAESPSKPDPYIFLKAAGKLGVNPTNCLVIEDAVAGVQAAKAARMKCVAVTTSNPEEKLGEADLVFDNLNDMTSEHIAQLFQG